MNDLDLRQRKKTQIADGVLPSTIRFAFQKFVADFVRRIATAMLDTRFLCMALWLSLVLTRFDVLSFDTAYSIAIIVLGFYFGFILNRPKHPWVEEPFATTTLPSSTSDQGLNSDIARYLDASTDFAVVFMDSHGTILWASKNVGESISGTQDSKSYAGVSLASLLVDYAPPDKVATLFAGDRKLFKIELSRSSTSPCRWLKVEVQPFELPTSPSVCWIATLSDISDLKSTTRVLEKTQRFLESLMDANPCHIAILDEKANIVRVNSVWRRFADDNGYTGSDRGLGKNYLDTIAKCSGPVTEDMIQSSHGILSVLKGEMQDFRYEYRCDSPVEQRWFEMFVARFVVEDEVFAIVYHEDITKRKHNEYNLASQKERLRSIYEGSSDAMMLLDENGFFDCNSRSLEMMKVESKAAFAKLHPSDLSPDFQPCGTPSTTLSRDKIRQALAEGSCVFEWVHRRVDGTTFPAEVYLTALYHRGKTAVQASVRDISARKKADAELQFLNAKLQSDLEARTNAEKSLREMTSYLDVYRKIVDSHAIVAETDARGQIVYVNSAFCKISGYSTEELIGQNHRILSSGIHPKTMWRDMYRTAVREGVWHGEICNRAKDGSLYWVDSTVAPLYNEMGKVRGYFAIRADITGFKAANAAAEAANRAKSEFLANMSHEIRTPMAAILGYADLLGDENSDDPYAERRLEYVQTIKRNGEHLLSIINDILDLSKIEANKLTSLLEITDVGHQVDETLRLMSVTASAKGLKLTHSISAKVPKFIKTDATRLRQILVNLVGNSVKFSEQGAVRVSVDYASGEEPKLIIRVADSGIGMSEDQIGKLFQAFEQADASTTRKFGGSGLGLSISKRLAVMLGGDIEVTSQVGIGSVFTLNIRAEACEQPNVISLPVPDSGGPDKIANNRPLSGLKILLAEDGPDNQLLISYQLKKAGAEVTVAENGKRAVELMSQEGHVDLPLINPPPFDMVISDMQMPVMDGYQAVKLMREKGYERAILSLTAHAMQPDQERCIQAGCDAHLTKPINKEELILTCAQWAKRCRSSDTRSDSIAQETCFPSLNTLASANDSSTINNGR